VTEPTAVTTILPDLYLTTWPDGLKVLAIGDPVKPLCGYPLNDNDVSLLAVTLLGVEDGPDWLEERVMDAANDALLAGDREGADRVEGALTRVREMWRGVGSTGSTVRDLELLHEYAGELLTATRRLQDTQSYRYANGQG